MGIYLVSSGDFTVTVVGTPEALERLRKLREKHNPRTADEWKSLISEWWQENKGGVNSPVRLTSTPTLSKLQF